MLILEFCFLKKGNGHKSLKHCKLLKLITACRNSKVPAFPTQRKKVQFKTQAVFQPPLGPESDISAIFFQIPEQSVGEHSKDRTTSQLTPRE